METEEKRGDGMAYRLLSAWRMYAAALLLVLVGFFLAEGGLSVAFAAVATAGALALLCHALLSGHAAPALAPGRIRTALRERAQRTAFLPQRDPDASGRPRPRAPGRPAGTAA